MPQQCRGVGVIRLQRSFLRKNSFHAPHIVQACGKGRHNLLALLSGELGQQLSSAARGRHVDVIVSGLDAGVATSPNRLKVIVGTSEAQIVNLAFVPGQPGNVRIQFSIPADVAGPQALTVSIDGVSSPPFLVPIR